LIAAALFACLLCLAGCGGEPLEEAVEIAAVAGALERPVPKVVLIGLDGADWKIARPLMEAGKMPTLASLVAEGASGDLRSIEPMISPALWTTVVTGVMPERHGIRDFVYKKAGTHQQPIVDATIRERLALWNIYSALDLSVGIVDWYATWPAEAVRGFIVSDRIKTLGLDAAGVIASSHDGLEQVLAEPPALAALPALERLRATAGGELEGLDKALREDLYRYRVARELYRQHQPDLYAFYLKGLDAVGHFYWRAFEPEAEVYGEVPAGEHEQLGPIIPTYYELCDQLLGDFLEVVDEQTTVLVVSDHGFRAFGRPDSLIFDVDRLLAAMGLLQFEDPALETDRSNRRVELAATRAYSHQGTMIVSTFGKRDRPVYLNVAGRDPDGLIPQQRWTEERAEIKRRLEALRTDLDTPVFSNVAINETPAGSARQEPDLFLRVNPDIAFDYDLLIDGRPYSLADDLFWEYGEITGSHRLEGIFVARGPAIRAGAEIRGASLLDLAPTVLRLAGIPVPEDLDGQVLTGLFADAGEPRQRVRSYEALIERKELPIEEAPIDEQYRDRLRALGYVQ
jgi:predicted AlkP superfamily phosphohydrolase/phosphomutase